MDVLLLLGGKRVWALGIAALLSVAILRDMAPRLTMIASLVLVGTTRGICTNTATAALDFTIPDSLDQERYLQSQSLLRLGFVSRARRVSMTLDGLVCISGPLRMICKKTSQSSVRGTPFMRKKPCSFSSMPWTVRMAREAVVSLVVAPTATPPLKAITCSSNSATYALTLSNSFTLLSKRFRRMPKCPA